MTPAISVVIRTLGSARVAEALASLGNQQHRGFETVVVDMSGSGLGEILDRFQPRLPLVRRVTLGKPCSRPTALNAGIAAASAPLIAILDDDNLYPPDHLERLIAGLESSAADYVYTGVRHATYAADGRRIGCREFGRPFDAQDLLLGNYIYATGSAYRKSLWERAGGYDERFAVLEDWEFLIRAAQLGQFFHLPIHSGEVRSFTGREGVTSFHFETAAVRRCLVGVYWKHRRLYGGALRPRLKAAAAAHCRGRLVPRTGLWAHSVSGWRLELAADLMAWWTWQLAWRLGWKSA